MEITAAKTKGVELLLGDPKKAIIKLAIPAVISSLIGAVYQITDIIWVSGLGADALAVMGYVGPFFLVVMALGSCWAAGGGINISRKIGEDDKQGADELAGHTFVLTLISSVVLCLLFMVSARPLLMMMGAEKVIDTAACMVYIIAAVAFFQMAGRAAGSILYNEGDAKRTMTVALIGILLNIILDPVFIYVLELGVIGSAVASVVAMMVAFFVLVHWFVIKKITYISVRFKGFKFKKERVLAIFKLGLPITLAQLVGPLAGFFIISIISDVSGTDGVAVNSTGMRFKDFILLPTLGVAHAVTTVTAAAWGSRDYDKLRVAFYYALKIGLLLTGLLSVVTFFLAPQITMIFTWSREAAHLSKDLVLFIRMFSCFYMSLTIWTTSVCFFVGIGRSIYDFLFNFLKSLLFVVPLVYVFGSYLNFGLPGVWAVIIVGMWLQALAAFVLARMYLNKFQAKGKRI